MSGAVDGAIGGVTSAVLTPLVLSALDPNYDPLTTAQTTTATVIAMLAGGAAAGLSGQNVMAGATSAENEALNNTEPHFGLKNPAVEGQEELRKEMSSLDAHAGLSKTQITGYDEDGDPIKTFVPGAPALPGNATNTIAAPLNTYAVYPLGSGAASGALPPGYVTVSRWVSPAEASLWVQNQGTAIPSAVPQNGTPQVYVTTAGAPYPPGANGTVRIDFAVPSAMLQPGNASNNFQILQPSTSTPIYNVIINVPNGVILPKAK